MSSQVTSDNTSVVVKLEKLSMCRICLVDNVRMHAVADKSLQELYEKLTDIPFVKHNRPMLACFICYAKLKQCCQLQRQCLQAEEMFDRMLNESYELYRATLQKQLQQFRSVITTPIETINIVDDCQVEKDAIKVEIPAVTETQYEIEIVRLKDEPLSDTEETEITLAKSDNLSSKSHTQRQQRYYEKHKEIINKRKRDKRLQLNISQTPPATPAERNRNYRERNRQIINERRRHSRQLQRYLQQVNTECNVNKKDVNEQITKVKPDNQENLQSSNDNIIKVKAKNSSSSLRRGRSRIEESDKQENSNQELKDFPPQHSESNSEDDLPLIVMKFEEEEQPAKRATSKC